MAGTGRRALILGSAAGLAMPALARAQPTWPAGRPIRLVATFPPGGLADVAARLIAPAIGQALGTSVVVENRAGAGGTVGADLVAKSTPDGFALVISHASPHGIAPGIYPGLPYDPVRDFTHLVLLCDTANVLLVDGASPHRTLASLLDAAHSPAGARYGSSGIGSITHLLGEVLSRDANVPRLEHVPYRGSAPAMQDLFGGQIESVFDPLTTNVATIRDGTVRALAVSSVARVPAVPDVPTFAEFGLPRVTATTWIGISGPKGLPAPLAARITDAVLAAASRPEVRSKLQDLASYPPPRPVTGADFANHVENFAREWTAVAREANVTAS